MKIPKYVDEALKKRTKAAIIVLKNDTIVTDFINKHNIDVNSEDYCGGVEMYANLFESEDAIRQAIENH